MLREMGRSLHRVWLTADVALCIAMFGTIAYHPFFANSNGLSNYGPIAIGSMALFTGLAWQIVLGRFRVYESQRRVTLAQLLTRLLLGDAVAAAGLAAVMFTIGISAPPLMPLALAAGMFLGQAATRLPVMMVLRLVRRSGKNFRTVVVIGSGPRARSATDTILRHPEWGLRVIGYIDDGGVDFEPAVPEQKVHKVIELPSLLREQNIDEVFVACPRSMLPSLTPMVRECSLVGVPITLLTDLFGDQLPPPRVGSFEALTTLSFAPVHHNEIELMVKRAIDIVGSLVGLLLTAPFAGLAAIAIKLDSPGPVFFRQIRCGLNGRRFEMMKLRTMSVDAESRKHELLDQNEMDGPVFKMKADPRITAVGALLRRLSIDEFPQFWNVLKGDMSLVGPRPPTPDEVIHYQGDTRRRLSMRPGITCYWQVSGRNELTFAEWIKLDLLYIDTWSLMNDAIIVLRTIPEVLRARGAR
ncbi:MAG: sugar transferase [Myxococcota bacterium]|jgi:exopolysaccharide biosynthesis polyprenyl glycosylphosphotransferase|nr:sugar transferase [Myxococcota bacterium]